MSKNDSRQFFAFQNETNNSLTTPTPPPPQQRRLKKKSDSRLSPPSPEDDNQSARSDDSVIDLRRPPPPPSPPLQKKRRRTSGRDDSVVDDGGGDYRPTKTTKTTTTKRDSPSSSSSVEIVAASSQATRTASAAAAPARTIRSLFQQQQQKQPQPSAQTASTSVAASATATGQAIKRNEQNQLFPGAQSTSLPRRDGTAVAEMREPTARSAPWTGVKAMCVEMELDGNFTAVDIGRVNMGIVQISCRGDRLTVKNWKLLNLDALCSEREARVPAELFSTGGGGGRTVYGDEDRCHCLFKWIIEQSVGDGIFASDVVVIERQSFTREMMALQTTVQLAVVACKRPIVVRRNDPALDVPRPANCTSPALVVSANSVKTCYAAYYPRVTETLAAAAARQPWKKQRAFGQADANRSRIGGGDDDNGGGGGGDSARQYAQNKKSSVLYGQKLISVERIIELLGAKMSAEQRARFRAAKKDDIYDALWLALFAIETWLPAQYSRRRRGYGAHCLMYGALPQRRYRTYDALFEFASGVGTPAADVDELRETLRAYRASPLAVVDENGGDDE